MSAFAWCRMSKHLFIQDLAPTTDQRQFTQVWLSELVGLLYSNMGDSRAAATPKLQPHYEWSQTCRQLSCSVSSLLQLCLNHMEEGFCNSCKFQKLHKACKFYLLHNCCLGVVTGAYLGPGQARSLFLPIGSPRAVGVDPQCRGFSAVICIVCKWFLPK